jgi:hypothetical protein
MEKIYTSGKYLFAVAILAFGIIQLVTGNFMKGLLPVSASLPGRIFWVYFISVAFIALAIRIIINWSANGTSFILGLLLLLLFIYPHIPLLLSNIYNPNEWTCAFEFLAICSGAFILAGTIDDRVESESPPGDFIKRAAMIARYTFTISVVVFCVLQFKYVHYIATLIPPWIPFHLFWAYLVSFGFLGTSLSLLLNKKVRLATSLFGLMFLTWVLILHTPLVIANLHTEPEWTSLFVALAMSGIAFMIAETTYKKPILSAKINQD